MNDLTLDQLIVSRPQTLTYTRAALLYPKLVSNPEWRPDPNEEGFLALRGSLMSQPAAEQMTIDEAQWIVGLYRHTSWRGVASIVLGDEDQYAGSELVAVAESVLANVKKEIE